MRVVPISYHYSSFSRKCMYSIHWYFLIMLYLFDQCFQIVKFKQFFVSMEVSSLSNLTLFNTTEKNITFN